MLSSKILVLCKSFTLHTSVCSTVFDVHPKSRFNSSGISSTLLLCLTQAKSKRAGLSSQSSNKTRRGKSFSKCISLLQQGIILGVFILRLNEIQYS